MTGHFSLKQIYMANKNMKIISIALVNYKLQLRNNHLYPLIDIVKR